MPGVTYSSSNAFLVSAWSSSTRFRVSSRLSSIALALFLNRALGRVINGAPQPVPLDQLFVILQVVHLRRGGVGSLP